MCKHTEHHLPLCKAPAPSGTRRPGIPHDIPQHTTNPHWPERSERWNDAVATCCNYALWIDKINNYSNYSSWASTQRSTTGISKNTLGVTEKHAWQWQQWHFDHYWILQEAGGALVCWFDGRLLGLFETAVTWASGVIRQFLIFGSLFCLFLVCFWFTYFANLSRCMPGVSPITGLQLFFCKPHNSRPTWRERSTMSLLFECYDCDFGCQANPGNLEIIFICFFKWFLMIVIYVFLMIWDLGMS